MSNVNNNQMRVKKFATLAAFNAQKKNLEYPGIFMIADGTNIDGVAKNVTAADSFEETITRYSQGNLTFGDCVYSNGTSFVIGDIDSNSNAVDKQKFIAAGYQFVGFVAYTVDNSYDISYNIFSVGQEWAQQRYETTGHFHKESGRGKRMYIIGATPLQLSTIYTFGKL